ncbi:Hexokinase-1 [Exophiala dermatitidis]
MTLLDFFRSILRRLAAMLFFPSSLKSMDVSPKTCDTEVTVVEATEDIRTLDDLRDEIMRLFRYPCTVKRMLSMSSALRMQYKAKLRDSDACMLPSYCHTLPNGQEKGTYISLDVGGSTFRVALVELRGRHAKSSPMAIRRMSTYKIDEQIRRLPSARFFDWMAGRIQEMLEQEQETRPLDEPLPIGLAWSFPIEQTSHRGGKLQGMGKGFSCHEDTIGMELGTLVESACAKRQLNVRVEAIVNDSSATLLSQAYLDPDTSMGLILGTGTNAAAYLPTACMGTSKFGMRESSWFDKAEKVIINTELSMFGKSILPQTRWDQLLNVQHHMPDFQPLEYMTTGRYLGELLRLIIAEAVEMGGLFQGIMPERLTESYSLDTEILAQLEQDRSRNLEDSTLIIQKTFGLKMIPTAEEVAFLRSVTESISYRASAYIAVAVHALWALQRDPEINPAGQKESSKTSIACNGSVILKYPGFKDRCQGFLQRMIKGSSLTQRVFASHKIALQPTVEAAVFGAAVAVALANIP